MSDKLIYILNADTQNYPFYRLKLVVKTFEHELNEPIYQNSINAPKVVKPTTKKMFFFIKLWGLV